MTWFFLGLALAARSASASSKDVERLIAEASRQVDGIERLAQLASSPQAAPAAGWVSREEAAAYCAESPATEVFLLETDRQLLNACYAYVRRDPGPCFAMPAAFVSRNTEACLTSFETMATFITLAEPSPAALRVCEAGFGLVNPRLSREERVKACAALARPGDEAARCAAFREEVPRVFVGLDFQDCTDSMALALDGRGCGGFDPGAFQHALCRVFAAFRKARAGGDSGPCVSDYLCRTLRGDAGACSEGRSMVISSACAAAAQAYAGRGRITPASPALHLEIAETVAWAAHLQILDQGGRHALARLNEMMLGQRELEPSAAITGLLNLRAGTIDDLLYRAGQLTAAKPEATQKRAVEELGRRLERARGRVAGKGALP